MAANFPGAGNAVPSAVVQTESITSGVAVPSGSRVAVIMGEGNREETIVNLAVGNGNDGIGSDCTLDGTPDGRHFLLGGQTAVGTLIQNRTRVFRNGVELSVLEAPVDSNTFDSRFDVRVDIQTACIELQRASLVDQGGSFFRAGGANTGDGTITNLSLLDPNAPAETWTARVTSVQRDGYGNPIDGYAKFVVRGSVTGSVLDGYGNQIVWQSDGQIRDNGILQFAISEGTTPFVEGDSFVMEIEGGPLIVGDNLTATYIPTIDVNDPQFFEDINQLTLKHGKPSLDNRLSLGAQLAFANGTPGVFALQCAPSIPRRESYLLVDSSNGESDIEELTFELPLGVTPDADANINFFVTDAISGVEEQVIPNKVDFYDPTITSNPAGFVFGGAYSFSYTVILDDSVQKSGDDGDLTVLTGTTAELDSTSVQFGLDDVSATRSVRIENATNAVNNGTFAVVSVSNGNVVITNPAGFVSESDLEFQVLDSSSSSARILLTDDLALALGESLRCTLVDTKDADFFDPGWISAYDAAEKIEVDMVVPLPSQTISVIFQNGKSHVETMSGIKNKRERVLMTGAIRGLTPENVIGTEPAAVEDIGLLEGIQGDEVSEILAGNVEDLSDYGAQSAFGDSFRVNYFYPDEIVVQAGADRVGADGFFLGAAAAGYYSGRDLIQEPLTNKTLGGFTLTRDKLYSPRTVENITAAGIALLQPVAGGGRVIFGKTTTDSLLPEEEEQSVVFIRDRLAKDMRTAFEPFIGKAETPTFEQTLYARATGMMISFLSRRLITDFTDLTVERDPVEPRQWNVTVKVQPTFPVNWIFIRLGIGVL